MNWKTKAIRWTIPVLAIAITVTLTAWGGHPQNTGQNARPLQDTLPGKRKYKSERKAGDKDLDKELRDLDNARKELEDLKDFNWDKIKEDIDKAMKEIDMEKIHMDAENAIRKVDMEKMQKEVQESLSKIDFDKMKTDLDNALKEVDVKEELDKAKKEIEKAQLQMKEHFNNRDWQKELDRELKKIDSKEWKEEFEKAMQELKRSKADLDLQKLNMKDEMAKAREGIDKAKEEFKGYQEMIYSMEKEGLLSTKEDYKIEYKDGELFINGKKQNQEVTDKYKKYFKRNTTLKKEDGDFNIDID